MTLDAVRGLAILCMVVDHVCLIFGGPDLLRWSVGRVALPLFFVLGGFLVSRLTGRHAYVLALGLVLPVLVPWVDSPNVLVLFVAGAVVVVACRDRVGWLAAVAVLGLTLAANGWSSLLGSGYNPAAVLGLMCLGRWLRLSAGVRVWAWADRLPSAVGAVGRYPLTVYAGHLLVLQGFVIAGFWRV